MVKETAGQEFLLTIIHFEHYFCVRREIPGVTQVDEKGHEGTQQ